MPIKKRIPFHIQLSWLFATLIIFFGVTLGVLQFEKMSQILLVEVSSQYELIGQKVVSSMQAVYERAKVQTQLLARQDLVHATSLQQRLYFVPYLATAIDSSDATIAAYVAWPDGEFFSLRAWTDTGLMKQRFNAPLNTYWLVESITQQKGQWSETVLFLDQTYQELGRANRNDLAYDARNRPWYVNAQQHQAGDVTGTDPHYFHTDGMLGFSYATRSADQAQAAVVGVDIEMSELAEVLRHGKGTPSSRIALLTHDGAVLALQTGSSDPYLPAPVVNSEGAFTLPNLHAQDAPILFRLFQSDQLDLQGSHRIRHDGENWETFNANIAVPNGKPLRLIIATPYSELLGNIYQLREQTLLLSALVVLLSIGLAVYFSRFASRPLKSLADEAVSIAHFDFDRPLAVHSNITEVDDLAQAMEHMKSTIRSFLDLSVSLASESNLDRLLARVLAELSSVIGAEKGVLYLYEPQQNRLVAAHYRSNAPTVLQVEALKIIDINASSHPIAVACKSQSAMVSMQPEQCTTWFGDHEELQQQNHLLAIPLVDRNANLVGAIGLMLSATQAGIDVGRFKMAQAISGAAAVAIENQLLIHEQKLLLESFIELIAGAIDAKSPYTGGHCQRVPVLTKMLAQAACLEQSGEFADFNLSDNEWEQLHIAAWLHDCGKVTTPEHVVDKATKLETLTDRIHEIRMRFEVLKRDAQIAYWRELAQGGNQQQQRILDVTLAQLDDDFQFVASCNEGAELMDPAKTARLKQLAAKTWQRTLSDRIGISHDELQRKMVEPDAALPVMENLLADKTEHLIPRLERDKIAPDNPWGFKVDVPQFLYNRGELYNLCVGRGTLTAEERFKINEHMIQTIIMLEKLPFPRHLSRVPEIAGGHHEKMDGSGYPKRLHQQQMSLPARMMAIADIFEALTARDRPYKSGKKLSEALDIMRVMRNNHHIDAALFALFLRSGVYLDYARGFMNTEQIDDVDIALYV